VRPILDMRRDGAEKMRAIADRHPVFRVETAPAGA